MVVTLHNYNIVKVAVVITLRVFDESMLCAPDVRYMQRYFVLLCMSQSLQYIVLLNGCNVRVYFIIYYRMSRIFSRQKNRMK